MSERISSKPKFSELDLQGKVDYIMSERTPSPEEVIYEPVVEFLDQEGDLTREERGKVIALGDRTAISYRNLKQRVIEEREKGTVVVDEEEVDRTASFYLMYTLAARSSKEIAHTSILEQVNVGPDQLGGDPPIVVEGVSILSALRDVCSLRHFGFEAFSSRGGIFPEGYWRIPQELIDAGVGQKLNLINQDIYHIYLHLTRKGIQHYLQTTQKKEGEKSWEWQWRILNLSLDDARQVTNGTFLNHFSMHANSALSLREALVKLSSAELPETRAIADRLRSLAEAGLPTLMRYTESSPYTQGLSQKRQEINDELWPLLEQRKPRGFPVSRLKRVSITPDADKLFLAAFVANGGDLSFTEAQTVVKNLTKEKTASLMERIFAEMTLHDKPPEELELIQIVAEHEMSLGAIYEAIRHRLTTKILGGLTPYRDYTTPRIYQELGLENEYDLAMDLNQRGYEIVSNLGDSFRETFAPYYVARGHIIPFTMRISGYDIFHYLKVRASGSAHPDISGPAFELDDHLKSHDDLIFRHLVRKG